ncbi:MAG: hypothetical protein QXL50_00010 [Candidatus Pacearchaeota archaeon]
MVKEEEYVEYKGQKLFIEDAEFLEKYKKRILYTIKNNFISEIAITRGNEDIYNSGDLKKLKNLKELDIRDTAIKDLTYEKLPKSIEVIYANRCMKLKNYNLKNLNKLKIWMIRDTAIKDLTYEKLPEGIEVIYADWCMKLKNYNLKNLNKLKELKIGGTAIKELTYDKLPKSIEVIYARGCKNLTKCSLKNLKNLKKLDIAYSGIKKLLPEDIPDGLERLVVSNKQDISEIKKDPRFKNIEVSELLL